MYISQIIARTVAVWAFATAIWFPCWAIRRKGEFDLKLDRSMQTLCWTVIIFCFGWIGQLGPEDMALRVSLLAVSMPFFCWPNSVYHVVTFFRRGKATLHSKEGP